MLDKTMTPRRTTPVFLSFFLLLVSGFALPSPGVARVQEATVSVDVPPTQYKGIRLRNLPTGAKLTVEARTNGPIAVILVNSREFTQLPKTDRPLFSGKFDRKFSFSVTIPNTDHYYLVFVNSSATEARALSVTVRGASGKDTEALEQAAPDVHVDATALQTAQEKLNTFKGQLQRIFIFKSFPILVKPCGAARAFATEVGIVLCAEYAQQVYQVLGDKQKASDALMFTLFHELGHVLLRQWEFPAYENEELADEFATATMTLLGQKERVRAKAEFFAARPAAAESLAKTFRDDRHPLSVQRARNIIRWAKDPQLLHKWQTIFIPHLQTPILEKLSQQPSWVFDRELVRAELATRH